MTEDEWATSQDPWAMLGFLRTTKWVSDRKLRLFACAACHQYWNCLGQRDKRGRLEVSERYADGLATKAELAAAEKSAYAVLSTKQLWKTASAIRKRNGLLQLTFSQTVEAVLAVGSATVDTTHPSFPEQFPGPINPLLEKILGKSAYATILRDLFGSLPFREVRIDPSWLTWNNGTVPRLAEQAYAERQLPAGTLDPPLLGVLADALTDAGCEDTPLLAHLRDLGPHWRGCWAIDVLTGRT